MIPNRQYFPINQLAASFKHTAAAYKFYWFLFILDDAEPGHYIISKQKLFNEMVATSWYTINYFPHQFWKARLVA